MAHRDSSVCIYDSNHSLEIVWKNGTLETRCLNINIADSHDSLEIKMRDTSDFLFYYISCIDVRRFGVMQKTQSLVIDFTEFRTNLLDMLHQVHKHELFLKCETTEEEGDLIFYGKSKIKAIIFLTINFQSLTPKDILYDINGHFLELQTTNKNLVSQLQMAKTRLQDKDCEIKKVVSLNKQLERQFQKDLESLSYVFSTKLQECSSLLLHKILILTQRLLKLIQDVEVVKAESLLKSDSSARLLQSMETLRRESIETSKVVNDLKRENCNLKSIQLNHEQRIEDLNHTIQKQDSEFRELKRQRDEFEKDAKQAALIIAQKATANEELARDVVKANQMLVSFNHLLDTKSQEIDKLKAALAAQEQVLQEHNNRFHELCKDFEEYKAEFNQERLNKVSQDLFAANRRVEEVEKVNRETAKLNELLTRKLASGNFGYSHQYSSS